MKPLTTTTILSSLLCLAGCPGDDGGGASGSGPGSADGSAGTTVTSTASSADTSATNPTNPTDPTDSTDSTDPTDPTGVDTTAGPSGPHPLVFVDVPIEQPLQRATDMKFLPGTSEFLLLGKNGPVHHYALGDEGATLLGSFDFPDLHTVTDCGLISVAFDPDFSSNSFAYFGVCDSQLDSTIYRVQFSDDYGAIADTRAPIITVGHPNASQPWHNVGAIGFTPEGYLWAQFGDKTVSSSSQDTASNLGSIVRIIPNRTPTESGYTPAPDNPFAGDPTASPDIWAYGFRSPWRGLLDDQGRFWVGDVGSSNHEEVDIVTAPGQNFGWPAAEGACTRGDCRDYVDPIATWPHAAHPEIADDVDATAHQARVAWVGVQYVDEGNDRYGGLLTGKVLYGDSCIGYVRALEADAEGNLVSNEHMGHIVAPTGWGQAPDGYIYVVGHGSCGSGESDPPDVTLSRVELAP